MYRLMNQKTSILRIVKIICITALIFPFACKKREKQRNDEVINKEFDLAREQLITDIDTIIKDLPPPSDVPYLLVSSGAILDMSLVNILDSNIDKYASSKEKASLNLGIFIVDIGYLSLYERTRQAFNYIDKCQVLASSIGIEEIIDYQVVNRFLENQDNKDSLTAIVNDVMVQSTNTLKNLDELNSVALILAGSWIEGIYISTSVINDYPKDLSEELRSLILEPLVQIVVDQKKSLVNLIKLMKKMDDETVLVMVKDLEEVQKIYDEDLLEVEENIANNTGNYVLKPESIVKLTKKVSNIRYSIVNVE